jgi:hypothetical protein
VVAGLNDILPKFLEEHDFVRFTEQHVAKSSLASVEDTVSRVAANLGFTDEQLEQWECMNGNHGYKLPRVAMFVLHNECLPDGKCCHSPLHSRNPLHNHCLCTLPLYPHNCHR